MLEAVPTQKFQLRMAQRRGAGNPGLMHLRVELPDQFGRGLVGDAPETAEHAARTGLDRDPGQAQGGAIIADRGLAGAEDQHFQRLLTKPGEADIFRQPVHGQAAVEGQHETVFGASAELRMRGDVDQTRCALRQCRLQAVQAEVLIEQQIAAEQTLHGLTATA